MKKYTISILIFLAMILASACAPESIQRQGVPLENSGGDVQPGEAGPAGQVELAMQAGTPGEGVISLTPAPAGADSDSVVSSSGETLPSAPGGDQPGMSESGLAGGGAPGRVPPAPENWLLYQDETFKFSISYPDVYVVLTETETLKDIEPTLVQRVRFQDKQLASGETAALEPPQFTIEVFENPGRVPISSYLESVSSGWQVEPFDLGGLSGYRVSSNLLMAPNEFYYFTRGDYVYKLTPLGEYAEEMLQSFQTYE